MFRIPKSLRLALVSLWTLGVCLAPVSASDPLPVDLQLVLAVDVSRSMSRIEQVTQRAGYAQAFRDPEVLKVIQSGPLGRIGVTYMEWAGVGHQSVVVPWTSIEDRASADAFASALEDADFAWKRRTSISAALVYGATLLQQSPFEGGRWVIDISGDGPNNDGVPVTTARDAVLEEGIVINGLPLILKSARTSSLYDVSKLDIYYEDCVIGGAGAFLVTLRDISEFAATIKRKLVREIAMPATIPDSEEPRIEKTQGFLQTDCLIGEKLWKAGRPAEERHAQSRERGLGR